MSTETRGAPAWKISAYRTEPHSPANSYEVQNFGTVIGEYVEAIERVGEHIRSAYYGGDKRMDVLSANYDNVFRGEDTAYIRIKEGRDGPTLDIYRVSIVKA